MSQESAITIELVHGGYVLHTSTDTGDKTEVFVSTAKLIKAVRAAIDDLTLIPKKSGEAEAE